MKNNNHAYLAVLFVSAIFTCFSSEKPVKLVGWTSLQPNEYGDLEEVQVWDPSYYTTGPAAATATQQDSQRPPTPPTQPMQADSQPEEERIGIDNDLFQLWTPTSSTQSSLDRVNTPMPTSLLNAPLNEEFFHEKEDGESKPSTQPQGKNSGQLTELAATAAASTKTLKPVPSPTSQVKRDTTKATINKIIQDSDQRISEYNSKNLKPHWYECDCFKNCLKKNKEEESKRK